MGTSKSTEAERKFTAGVSIFSGRPDPTWPISAALGSKLEKLYGELERHEGGATQAPPLGYRGAFLRDDAGNEWSAYRGVVTFNSEAREDENRAFERELVTSAPDGLIPPALLAAEFD